MGEVVLGNIVMGDILEGIWEADDGEVEGVIWWEEDFESF